MDIDQFYDADERRRQSPEVELGTEWRDAHDVRYELNWVQDTGELYVMREPIPPMREDPFGGIHVEKGDHAPVSGMVVVVVAHVNTREQLEEVVRGWQKAMSSPNSIGWLADRLKAHNVADPSWAGRSS